MPWLRSRTERSSGITTWAIEWREGGRHGTVRARQLGAVTEAKANLELAAMKAGHSRLPKVKRDLGARRASEDYRGAVCGQRRTSRRRNGAQR